MTAGASVRAYDPTVSAIGDLPSGNDAVELVENAVSVCDGADVLVVLTEWDEFRWQDPVEVAALMAAPTVVAARNLLDRARWERHGFTHRGVGH